MSGSDEVVNTSSSRSYKSSHGKKVDDTVMQPSKEQQVDGVALGRSHTQHVVELKSQTLFVKAYSGVSEDGNKDNFRMYMPFEALK